MPGSRAVFETISDEVAARSALPAQALQSFNLAQLLQFNNIMREQSNCVAASKRLGPEGPHAISQLQGLVGWLQQGGAWLDACIKAVDDNQVGPGSSPPKHPRVKLAPITGTYLQWLDFRDLGLAEELDHLLQFEAQLFFTDRSLANCLGFQALEFGSPSRQIEEAFESSGYSTYGSRFRTQSAALSGLIAVS